MSVYVYCLCDESATVTRLEGVAGVGGEAARVVLGEGLAAVVSEFGGERVPLTRENLRAHNAVLSRVLAATTPLPFRFGTVSDEARLRAYVEANAGALALQLARGRGAVEMSVKVIRGAGAVDADEDAAGVGGGAAGANTIAGTKAGGAGAAFLEAKRREYAGGERLKARAEEASAWLAGLLEGAVRESRVSVNPAESLFLSAAHLVERAGLDDYRARVRAAREERGTDLRFLTSGPWPPYSFCEVRPPN